MATIHPDEPQQMDLRDKPALGAFVSSPAVVARGDVARWAMQMSIIDYQARTRFLTKITFIHEACCRGRRLDLLAEDLRSLAEELEDVPQPRTGGWPLRRPVDGDQSHLEEGVAA
ncbi:MAG TPA: hypothetical protein VK988_09765 [Acidimicrobiales bacterium]|nr:hypothetical protein [Acidimicrobiales bacterium]